MGWRVAARCRRGEGEREGAGAVEVDGVAQRFGVGDVVQLPLGSVLAIESEADGPLRYLIVKAAS